MKILVADNVSESALEVLRAEPSWEVVFRPKKPAVSITEEIKDADALIVRSATKANAELLGHAGRLRVIGRAGVGVDNVDLLAATQKGIVVMNTPGGNAVSVAEHSLALMLALARRIAPANTSMKAGKWEKKKLTGNELRSKTLGLFGFGMIGREMARRAKALEMEIVACDPYVSSMLAEEQEVKLVALPELLKVSDYISLHAKASPETRHMLNAKTLSQVKRGVRIVNCARGELIAEEDLLQALETGQVAGAALDVFSTEPTVDSELVKHLKVVVTPHIGGQTVEAQSRAANDISNEVLAALQGAPLHWKVA
jgi:D-3-phosphoglycerate dehydrogenase